MFTVAVIAMMSLMNLLPFDSTLTGYLFRAKDWARYVWHKEEATINSSPLGDHHQLQLSTRIPKSYKFWTALLGHHCRGYLIKSTLTSAVLKQDWLVNALTGQRKLSLASGRHQAQSECHNIVGFWDTQALLSIATDHPCYPETFHRLWLKEEKIGGQF